MIARPPVSPIPGPYWPATGTIPKSEPIPAESPNSRQALPGLVASVWPSNQPSDTVVFEDAVNPGVDPADPDMYLPWVKPGGWIYIPSVNKVFRIGALSPLSATAFKAEVTEGILPLVQADVAYQRQDIQIPGNPLPYTVIVDSLGITINGAPITQEFKSPAQLGGAPRPVAYDASVGTATVFTNQYT